MLGPVLRLIPIVFLTGCFGPFFRGTYDSRPDDTVLIACVHDDGRIELADGRTVRLFGVQVPAGQLREYEGKRAPSRSSCRPTRPPSGCRSGNGSATAASASTHGIHSRGRTKGSTDTVSSRTRAGTTRSSSPTSATPMRPRTWSPACARPPANASTVTAESRAALWPGSAAAYPEGSSGCSGAATLLDSSPP